MIGDDIRVIPVVPVRWSEAGLDGIELPSARLGGSTPEHGQGQPEAVGLWDALAAAHVIEDVVVGPPPVAAGLWRVLTLVAARVTGLDHPGDAGDRRRAIRWLERREEVLRQGRFDWAKVDEYFGSTYASRFGLFDVDRPWLQDPRLAVECVAPSGLNKLVLGRPAGNNQPWMEHHHDKLSVPISAVEAAHHLLGQLYYGAPGRCTARAVGKTKEANTTAGPLRGLISYQPVGANLFESLVASIPYPKDRDEQWDKAPWELDVLPDPLQAPPPVSGVGGLLAGRFRHAILLVPSPDAAAVTDAYLTWAWRLPQGPVQDPFLIYQTSRKGEPYARAADAGRALWRDLDGLLLNDVGTAHARRPVIFDQAERLPAAMLDRLRVRAFGFDQDRAQVNDRQWYAAETPPVLAMLNDPEASLAVSRAREAAERVERHLVQALRNAWTAINDPSNGNGRPARSDIKPGPWPAVASSHYWFDAEEQFWRLVRSKGFQDAARRFVGLGLRVFDAVTGDVSSPRAVRAVENARGYIFRAATTSTGRA
ncbi:type I-E CRISPR-associated protein Cse1/CasA [Nocardia terpenica]|uniref:type I-E CRISPR-associated protein Cse1/CasA n=1 Tax=Nocardia terpenica TaxID=455432 RepID=UPI0018934A2A|nr:type I-E CRISPR-associated protein Cse1/CasA [Nocardia terpenica]MBF6063509.1 type I-E CRISPR-associated protein Cse1/CasA [Nocardia terpenica]MBF6106065.1 type I-E CRISPR-associated protein Cse1/CasA [Nocardia terpenica]MBF6113350.1 type I-E CRISPR-associated protein Cse1/CasA [Nocardia terpenica]MBF6119806.1 type I-E CRISPR-associated protein Cse1/CasA [Nocardia terpenica]MBF6152217.1 type I-E CRISPR-associated protein Cse1/CasA [Nocardia terpenica]